MLSSSSASQSSSDIFVPSADLFLLLLLFMVSVFYNSLVSSFPLLPTFYVTGRESPKNNVTMKLTKDCTYLLHYSLLLRQDWLSRDHCRSLQAFTVEDYLH